MLAKDSLVQEMYPWCIPKVEYNIIMLSGLFDSAQTF
jgi:hypothetical protein